MTHYAPISDAVGILVTRIVTRHWQTGSDGISVVRHEEYRPVECLVWRPNEMAPTDYRRLLTRTMAEAK